MLLSFSSDDTAVHSEDEEVVETDEAGAMSEEDGRVLVDWDRMVMAGDWGSPREGGGSEKGCCSEGCPPYPLYEAGDIWRSLGEDQDGWVYEAGYCCCCC